MAVALLLLVSFGLLQCGSAVAQSDEKVPSKYTSDKAFFLLALHPQKIAEAVGDDNEDVKTVHRVLTKMSGMKIGDLERVLVQMDTAAYDGESEQAMTIMLQFKEKINAKKILAKMFAGQEPEEVEADGKKFYRPEFEGAPCVYVAGENTLVLANEETLKTAMNNDDDMGGSKLAGQLSSGDTICATFDMESEDAQDILREMLSQMPVEGDSASDILENAKTGSVRLRLDSDTPFHMVIESADQESSDKLVEHCNEFIKNAEDQIDEMESQLSAVPPNISEVAESLFEEMRDAVEGMSVSSSGNTVTMKIEKKGGMTEAAKSLVKLMAEGLKMAEAFMPDDDF